MKNEFNIYNKIINEELRPHLERNSTEQGIKKLEHKFFSYRLLIGKDDNDLPLDIICNGTYNEIKEYFKIYISKGEKFKIEFDTVNPKNCIISSVDQQNEQPLIDLDIPPPLNSKAVFYLDLIETEFNRIKTSAKEIYNSISLKNDLIFYANKNIDTGMQCLRDLDVYSKKMYEPGLSFLNDANSYICYILEIFIVRSIIFFQTLFFEMLKLKPMSEFDLKVLITGKEPIRRSESYINPQSYLKKFKDIEIIKKHLKKLSTRKIIKFQNIDLVIRRIEKPVFTVEAYNFYAASICNYWYLHNCFKNENKRIPLSWMAQSFDRKLDNKRGPLNRKKISEAYNEESFNSYYEKIVELFEMDIPIIPATHLNSNLTDI